MSLSSNPPGPDPQDRHTILLRPKAFTSETPPEDLGQELEAWDTLYHLIQGHRQMRLKRDILRVTGKRSMDEVMMIDSTPADDYYPDLEKLN